MRSQRRPERSAEDEFVAYVVAWQEKLQRVAFLMCGDWHRAEDIVQTALTKLYMHWARIRRDEGAESYARRMVVNTAIDESRRPWRRERPTAEVPDSAAIVEHPMDMLVIQALLSLSPRQRAVVVLRYIEDLDVAQTADQLGISLGTVKSQAAKALATLQKRLSSATVEMDQGGFR